jgi:asparagine synthase (glutamine-hydrolysing)
MCIIFGFVKERGAPVQDAEVQRLAFATERYATGVGSVYASGRLGMGFQPYSSHLRSCMEDPPVVGTHGLVLSFDGRLDNYKEVAEVLGLDGPGVSDSQIVLSAFLQWGEECFSHFVGDWALALWSEKDQTLYLARDHAGTRTLYFQHGPNRLLWSTHLDTFRACESALRLAEDYVACYLTSRPIGDLTPYEGIRSVPPAHYLVFRNGAISRRCHWTSMVTSTVRYKCDEEYEAHFLALFRQSVERRTGPGAPILAQLSGGMDSTAIVCMSDHIRRSTDPAAEILDTVSFYDDSEPSLNERPYFSLTEANRGKVGTHIDTAFSQRTFEPHDATNGVYLLPGSDSFSIQQERRFYDGVWQRGYRSILSGIGGDEVLGGVPKGLPELADYLVSGNIRKLLSQALSWSLINRDPIIGTLSDTARYAIRLYSRSQPHDRKLPPWISSRLRQRSREIEGGNFRLHSRIGIAPHRIDNGLAWWSIMETLPHLFPQLLSRPEFRYPFLDKDLVNYLFSIPREQILRPGRRRSLMRRGLVKIVPHEILERRRKAFQLRASLSTLQQVRPNLEQLFANSAIASAGFVDIDALRFVLERTAHGDPEWWQALIKTIALELWLKTILHEKGRHLPRKRDGLHLSLTA